ncbi:MAG: YggT family protein [Pseudonocardiaceae bacterium]
MTRLRRSLRPRCGRRTSARLSAAAAQSARAGLTWLTHAGTEPVISPVRRLLPPLQAGGLSIDLAFTAVFVFALILRSIAFSL